MPEYSSFMSRSSTDDSYHARLDIGDDSNGWYYGLGTGPSKILYACLKDPCSFLGGEASTLCIEPVAMIATT